MAEVNKILYIVVTDDEDDGAKGENLRGGSGSFQYTRPVLQSTLQLIGCKSRHAFKISKRVFGILTSQSSKDPTSRMRVFVADFSLRGTKGQDSSSTTNHPAEPKERSGLGPRKDGGSKKLSSESYKRRTTVTICRTKFLDVVCEALAEYKYVGPNQRADLVLACRLRERKESVTVLLCGTSGCGKSTLSSLLAGRLGITTVISTDSIRHMMRSFVDEKQDKLLWASTYHAGECLDPVAVAEAKARRKARKKAGIPNSFSKDKLSDNAPGEKHDTRKVEAVAYNAELIKPKQMAIEGFKAQSEMVIESLDRLITAWEERKESVIVEGVHLSLNFVMGLMKKHPSIVPFMVYITNEDKHLERFSVRAKYMTLDPEKNKYVKYIRNIRRIQEYLCNRADKHLVPKINNTNVDKSVATIHATLFGCLRRRESKEPLYDATTNTVSVVYEEYRNQCLAESFGSKGMFQLIQRKGSSRHLMALVGDDGYVAKAWPVGSYDNPILGHGSESGMGAPMYGPLIIDKAEPVNLQFGHFGLSAWPKDTGSASYASSFDESRTDWTGTETGSRCYSSCCSSPRMSDRPSKQRKEELSVSGSDEEVDNPNEPETDDDISDKHTHEEIEGGSVDEGSIKSDEDDQMHDDLENGYSYYDDDDDEQFSERLLPPSGNLSAFLHNSNNKREIYPPTLDMFLKTQSDPFRLHNDEDLEKKMKPHSVIHLTMLKRSLSIPPTSIDNSNTSPDP